MHGTFFAYSLCSHAGIVPEKLPLKMALIVCRGRQGVYTFIRLGMIVLGICGLSFGPFIMAGQLTQVWPVKQPQQASADSTAGIVLVQACIRPETGSAATPRRSNAHLVTAECASTVLQFQQDKRGCQAAPRDLQHPLQEMLDARISRLALCASAER